jgi:type IV pilus assembly protein PilY1
MKRLFFIVFALTLFYMSLHPYSTDAAIMEDYCVVPPYVIQNVPPNVMIVLDNSGSMFNFAYYDGFETTTTADDNSCANSGSPCTGFTNPGTYPTYKYYGYFNPDYWYTYSSNRFVPAAPKTGSGLPGARAKNSSEWDGNFLNWLTMRRTDVIRKAMTGGKTTTGEGAGYDRLIGEVADCDSRGTYKEINNAENYVDDTYTGTRCMRVITNGGSCNGSGSGTSSFDIAPGSSCSNTFGSDYNVAVRVPIPVEGVLQNIVGARARIGLTFYKTSDGGYVQVYVSGGSLSSTVNQINLTRPTANTPMAEALWTTEGYFAQQASMEGGPGPRYGAGDFQINNNVDPLNYGTGGVPRYPHCAKSYVLLVTDGEPCSDGNLPGTIADYASAKSAFNCSGGGCPATSGTAPENYSFTASTFASCSAGGYVAGIEDVALHMHTTDLRDNPTLGVDNISGVQNLTLYTVFAFGKGSTLLKYASINGGFEDTDGSNTPNSQSEWDNNNDGEPDTYYEASDGAELEQKIQDAFLSILKRASSGTAASVLASGEGQGANLIQAVFYPRRRFGNDIIAWSGLLQNLWYHVDPLFKNSNIIEDTLQDEILNLTDDYIVQLSFDTALDQTIAKLYADTNGDGAPDSAIPTEVRSFENLNNLWEAGKMLWGRDLNADPRKIYTTLDGSTFLTNGVDNWGFAPANAAILAPYLNATDTNGNASVTDDAANIINYVHGFDIVQDANADGVNDYRERTVVINGISNVWKLGDVLNSTPRIASWMPLNTYDTKYNDTTYKAFVGTAGYVNKGMVYAGGNDGMLHAFKLGQLELRWIGQTYTQKARLTGPDLGKEMWAFIPKNALPYLKYMSDPDYCHIYSVDLSPYIFDASIGAPGSGDISGNQKPADGSTWRTILIGGMRTGGACASTTTTTATRPDVSGDGSKDFVNTPVDVGGASVGYSSYFALDVTDENNPQLLWEFSNPQLGYATSGPAIVRIGADTRNNGQWFVVFGSGPTGPVSISDMQFMGSSDQNLRLFVLDLKTGALASGYPKDTGIPYAFAGSMLNSTNDSDMNYQDDAVYIGYTKRAGAGTVANPYSWTNGGVGRLVTKEDPVPNNWQWSLVLDNIGPVTSSIARLQKNSNCSTSTGAAGCLWLFFGTGRYYYAQQTGIDDQSGQRLIYGVKEPCVVSSGGTLAIDPTCTTPVSGLTDVTSISGVPTESAANAAGFNGWFITLDPAITGLGAERIITDPLAVTTGLVFFTSSEPYTDPCAIGGKTYIWALRYNTGGSSAYMLKGTALIQVSTAAIEQVTLKDAFKQNPNPPNGQNNNPSGTAPYNPDSKGDRRTGAMEGLPPTQQGLSLMTQPPPIKRTIHIREK